MEKKIKKNCSKCGKRKPLDSFGVFKKTNDGLQSYCKMCQKIINKKYYSENKEKIQKYQKEYGKKLRSKQWKK